MNLTPVGTSRRDVPGREAAGGTVAPLNAARTAQRAVPTMFVGSMRELFRENLTPALFPLRGEGDSHAASCVTSAHLLIEDQTAHRRDEHACSVRFNSRREVDARASGVS